MFEKFYHFREKPFQLAPNPDYLYQSEKHQKALTYLEYGLTENVGIIVLSGEIGSGKTTTAQYVLRTLGDDYDIAMIANTNITSDQMLRMIHSEFEIDTKDNDKSSIIESLNLFFIDQYEAGKHVLLVIDEAQNLSSQALEEVRMLSNLQSDHYPLLQIMLIGQPELLQTLKRPSMQQFTQRVAVHFHLTALDEVETAQYIAYRIKKAGGPPNLFTSAALKMIYEMSDGVPRSINLMCQAALVYGFADEAASISQDIIRQIAQDNIGVGIETEPDETLVLNDESQPMHHRDNLKQELRTIKQEITEIKKTMDERVKRLEMSNAQLKDSSNQQLILLLKEEQRRNIEITQKYAALEREYKKVRFAVIDRHKK